MTKRNIDFYAVFAAVCTAVFSLSLFPILGSQLQDTLSLPISVIGLFMSYLTLDGLVGLGLATIALFIGRRFTKWTIVAAISIATIAWIKGAFMQWNYGPLDGTAIDWSLFTLVGMLDVALIVAIAVLAIWQHRAVVRHALPACAFLCLAQILFMVWISPAFTKATFKDLFAKQTVLTHKKNAEILSASENLILIVLDTFPSDIFGEMIQKEESLKSEFSGFSFFPDTISAYPYTWLSVPSVLTGQFYLNQLPFPQYLYEAYRNPLSILPKLKQAGYYVELNRWGAATPIPHLADLSSNSEQLYFPRFETLGTLQSLALYFAAPQFIKQFWYERTHETIMDFVGLRENNLAFIREGMLLPIRQIERPVAKFIHLKGPHVPLNCYTGYGFDYFAAAADRNAVAESATTSRENFASVARQSIKAVSAYLEKLRQAGAYDRSTIVILGDHGAGLQGQDFVPPATGDVSGVGHVSPPIQMAAFPLLLVKSAGTTGPLQTKSQAVSLSDINCSLHSLLEKQPVNGCPSLFKPEDPTFRKDRLHYSVRSKIDKDWFYPVMRKFTIGSPGWSSDSWNDAGELFFREKTLKVPAYHFGSLIQFGEDGNSRTYEAFGWKDPDKILTWTTGPQSTVTIPLKEGPAEPIVLEAIFAPFVYAEKLKVQRVQVHANGERIAEWFASYPGRYRAMIPQRLTAGGSIRIRFELPDAISPLALGINNDPLIYGIEMQSLVLRQAKYQIGEIIRFGRDGNSAAFQIEGWNDPSEGFTWTLGKTSRIAMPVTDIAGKQLRLEASFVPFVLADKLPTQRAEVYVNDRKVAEWSVDRPGQFTANIPSEIVSNGIANIRFDLPDATSPVAMGLNSDANIFALQVVSLTLRSDP